MSAQAVDPGLLSCAECGFVGHPPDEPVTKNNRDYDPENEPRPGDPAFIVSLRIYRWLTHHGTAVHDGLEMMRKAHAHINSSRDGRTWAPVWSR